MSHHTHGEACCGHEDHCHGGGGHHVHVVPVKIFTIILGILIVLTGATVWAAGIDFGNPTVNLVIAMVIASVKAGLVVLFFMHLKYENPLTWLYAIFPIFLLILLIGGVFIDNPLRDTPMPVEVVTPEK